MLCRGGRYFARNAGKPLFDKLAQRPTRAITRQHRKIMQMEFAGAVSVRNFVVVNFTEPIVGSYCAAVGKNKPAHGIGDG